MSNIFSGIFILIIGPSGTGKGTAINVLRERHPEWIFPVSATTRPPRPNERDGETYHFLSPELFEKKKKAGDFLEWAVVHKDYEYGTLAENIVPYLKRGLVVLREVDIQGFLSIQEKLPKEVLLSFFFLPPAEEVLRKRILDRAPIDAKALEARMESLRKEMQFAELCNVEIMSKDGDLTYAANVIEAELEKRIKKS